jgi:hypothetical protein
MYVYVIDHPRFGLSVRLTPCYGKDRSTEPGWKQTRVRLSTKTLRKLRADLAEAKS